jgi:hypothetical protein
VPEIGTPGLMSGDGKRGVGHRPQATAPILDSTEMDLDVAAVIAIARIFIRDALSRLLVPGPDHFGPQLGADRPCRKDACKDTIDEPCR